MYVSSLDKMSKMVAEVPNLFWEDSMLSKT